MSTLAIDPMTLPVSLSSNGFTDYVTAPPRLNFAGFCMYCLTRGCVSEHCVGRYERSQWGLCDRCEGIEFAEGGFACEWCHGGVVEVTDAYTGPIAYGRGAVRSW